MRRSSPYARVRRSPGGDAPSPADAGHTCWSMGSRTGVHFAVPSISAAPATEARQLVELHPEGGVALVDAPEGSGPGQRLVFADAPHLGAQVLRLEVDRHAVSTEHIEQRVSGLVGHPLLHPEPGSDDADQPRELAE